MTIDPLEIIVTAGIGLAVLALIELLSLLWIERRR